MMLHKIILRFKKIEKWFDLYLGYYFTNGRKLDTRIKRLNKKYNENKKTKKM